MRYLLDTHVILWALDNDKRLSETMVRILQDSVIEKYVSIASAWEVAIKVNSGKLRLDGGVSEFFETVHQNQVELLPITARHLEIVEILPLIHRDPFDRLLIAATKAEGMTILTADENIHQYEVPSVW